MKTILLMLVMSLMLFSSCLVMQQPTYKSTFRNINSFNNSEKNSFDEPYLKAHLKSGSLCIFTDTVWTFDEETNLIIGNAKLYNTQRVLEKTSVITMNVDTVVLFESNRQLNMENRKSRLASHTFLVVVDAAFGAICTSVPKACWGSCPTFYTGEGDYLFNADAEGFSEAIVPSLEYGDIDALYSLKPNESNEFSIKMKNEALETHVIRNVKILALEKDLSLTAYHAFNDKFFVTDPVFEQGLKYAMAEEGDITDLLRNLDQNERFSLSDSKNMKSKEEILLKFNKGTIVNGGLVLNFRQTLMTTYLIYSVMGYMGNTVSDFLSEVEKNNQILKKHNLIDDEMGGIDIYLVKGESQIYCGSFNETGPIASNLQIIPLPELPDEDEITVKLVLNRGLWRIDYAALTSIVGESEPIELLAERVSYKNEDNQKFLQALNSETEQLISMPGDEYELYFSLPESDEDFDLFLYSKGYYLEWMRESWLNDKNLLRLNSLMENPDRFFRKEAKRYSKYESQMEKIFWSSRIDTENFSSHE
ncbi:MAG: hypothetical protein K9H49_10750 [Bacteroidales bacterium]|nr:hypothetical protein [Bacteroidales bacterium]MCF8391916.1 hypothetical protein [Bacteroidales bacterium]